MVVQFCAGIIYMWSVFKQPVADYLKWSADSAGLTSSIMLAMFVFGIILGGRAQDKLGPGRVTFAGSVLIGMGMAATSLATPNTPWLVWVTYGVVGGFGVGTVYTSTIAVVQKWFPDRRGFASGMTVSAFGFSLVVFAPLATALIKALDVMSVFFIFGMSFLVICGVSSLFLQNPPQQAAAAQAAQRRMYSPSQILKTRQFYLLVGGLFFTLPAYFILNPNFKSLALERGLSENLAVLGVMITGIGSACGRLAVSWVSDKIGRKAAMLSIAGIILAATLLMIIAQGYLYLVCITLIAFGFGGAAGVYAAMTAESFGSKHSGMNFGLVMLGFGASALVFPLISKDLTVSFILAASTCAVAMLLVALMRNPKAMQ
jgi:OFA family oxalate/formate antiporter-like MFS transporter